MQLKLYKYNAAGNDFLAVDNREQLLPGGPERGVLVRALCDRQAGIGADGVLVLESSGTAADFRMTYYNRDGSEGEMCGNGARCIARFAVFLRVAGEEMSFDTMHGLYKATSCQDGIEIRFPDIHGTPRRMELKACEREWDCDFITVGVPHIVAWARNIDEIDVRACGQGLRGHHSMMPEGSNVNFASCEDLEGEDNVIHIRTYERGVEAETLACGTGAVSTAITRAWRRELTGDQCFTVVPASGERLRVKFTIVDSSIRDISLTGPARMVFSTVVKWEKGEIVPA